jgi:hypothetical protein
VPTPLTNNTRSARRKSLQSGARPCAIGRRARWKWSTASKSPRTFGDGTRVGRGAGLSTAVSTVGMNYAEDFDYNAREPWTH